MKKKSAKNPRGRPRAFSVEEALDAAMLVFAEKGFEGASLTDLTVAMGINRNSMYATFGNKDALFRLAMEKFTQSGTKRILQILESDTARQAVDHVLRDCVARFTDPDGPGVCFLTQGPLTGPDASTETRRYAAKKRAWFELALRTRFDQAIEAEELPRTVSSEDLSLYYAVVVQGLALHAQHGGSREQLLCVVDAAMKTWPEKVST
jgi:AcrR family transcriptional regulator